MSTTDQTTPQHLTALGNANRSRLGQAAIKAELGAGTMTAVAALDEDRAQPMRIGALLEALPRWGTTRTGQLLTELGIHEHRRVRDLTVRQRQALVSHFEPPPPKPAPAPPPPPPPGMEPERVDARVASALLKGPATRTELELRMREMLLPFDDLDASLRRLFLRRAIVVRRADGFELYSVGGAVRA